MLTQAHLSQIPSLLTSALGGLHRRSLTQDELPTEKCAAWVVGAMEEMAVFDTCGSPTEKDACNEGMAAVETDYSAFCGGDCPSKIDKLLQDAYKNCGDYFIQIMFGDTSDTSTTTDTCTTDADCTASLSFTVCVSGTCTQPCTTDADCLGTVYDCDFNVVGNGTGYPCVSGSGEAKGCSPGSCDMEMDDSYMVDMFTDISTGKLSYEAIMCITGGDGVHCNAFDERWAATASCEELAPYACCSKSQQNLATECLGLPAECVDDSISEWAAAKATECGVDITMPCGATKCSAALSLQPVVGVFLLIAATLW